MPAEHAVLLVVRDRTEELKREQAEREFVSNAAHELRNPLAGIISGIEVLRGGAKDDPEARDRFLARLADDAERMTRLTQSLLTLARVEAGRARSGPGRRRHARGGRGDRRRRGARGRRARASRSSRIWLPRGIRCCCAR